MSLTDFDYLELKNANSHMAPILFVTFTFLSVVILLNILIATLNTTFQRSYDKSKQVALMERARILFAIEEKFYLIPNLWDKLLCIKDEKIELVFANQYLTYNQPSEIQQQIADMQRKLDHALAKIKKGVSKIIEASPSPQRLQSKDWMIWVDLEMTGLDVDKERIIEIACIITDENLNAIAVGENLVIHQEDSFLNSMDDWNKKHHTQVSLLSLFF
jgi:uncharacterized protein YprB with RNaseH-like and TPR domain